ncbi:MAG: hypothetical protein Q9179_007809, partial [Wetmoreana sp. 5 TL-2023]
MNSPFNNVFMGALDDNSEKLQAIPPVTKKRKLANETVVPQSRIEISAIPIRKRRGTSYGPQEPLTKKARVTPVDNQAAPVDKTATAPQRLYEPPPVVEDLANGPNDRQATPLTNNGWGTSYGPQYIPDPAFYPFTFRAPFNPPEVNFAIPPPIPAL